MSTLPELLKGAELTARKLSNHLRYDVVPRAQTARANTKSTRIDSVSDRQIRDCMAELLEAEKYTGTQYEQLMTLCIDINKLLERVLSESN